MGRRNVERIVFFCCSMRCQHWWTILMRLLMTTHDASVSGIGNLLVASVNGNASMTEHLKGACALHKVAAT